MISVNMGVYGIAHVETQLSNEGHVATVLLVNRIYDNRLARLRAGEQVGICR